MKNLFSTILLLVVILSSTFSQIKPASCVRGDGLQLYSDILLGAIGACNCQKTSVFVNSFPFCNSDGFNLFFEDNFDGISLDSSKWEIQPWGQGALKNSAGLEYNSLDNVSLFNGICNITAKKETVIRRAVSWLGDTEILSDGLANLRTFTYTSSNIWSKDKFHYGKYETRCKLPVGKGFWPAFWTFGGPTWNEIDFFDNYDGINSFITSMGYNDGHEIASGCNASFSNYDFSQWHTITCIFDFDRATWLIDNNVIRVLHRFVTVDGNPVDCDENVGRGTYYQENSWPLENMSIILNLAIGSGNGPAPLPDSATPFPSSFEIDYVKYWKRKESKIFVFPNPFNDYFIIKNEHENNAEFIFAIYNFTGSLIKQFVRKQAGQGIYEEQFNTEQLAKGIFFLVANTNGQIQTFKMIKI